MKRPRRKFLHLAAGAAALPFVSRTGWAQAYPTRPVRIVVGFAAGGGQDILARLLGQSLSERLSQPFLVENRPGAGSNVAVEAVVNAAPDGHMLLMVGPAQAINATLYDRLNFNFIRDIAPVAGLVSSANVMGVHPTVPVKTVPEFIAYAKANPGKLNMASGGIGASQHVSGELFKMMAGVDLTHVPYRGEALALPDLLSGQVQVLFGNLPSSLEHIRAGRLRPLAVTGVKRSDALPDVPTIGEFVAGYEAVVINGIGAPRNTPTAVIDRLNKAIADALADSKLQGRLAEIGTLPMPMMPAEFGRLMVSETDKWAKVVKFAGIKAE